MATFTTASVAAVVAAAHATAARRSPSLPRPPSQANGDHLSPACCSPVGHAPPHQELPLKHVRKRAVPQVVAQAGERDGAHVAALDADVVPLQAKYALGVLAGQVGHAQRVLKAGGAGGEGWRGWAWRVWEGHGTAVL